MFTIPTRRSFFEGACDRESEELALLTEVIRCRGERWLIEVEKLHVLVEGGSRASALAAFARLVEERAQGPAQVQRFLDLRMTETVLVLLMGHRLPA